MFSVLAGTVGDHACPVSVQQPETEKGIHQSGFEECKTERIASRQNAAVGERGAVREKVADSFLAA